MSVTNYGAVNRTYRSLIGNGLTYKVPRFQRDYSWDIEQWEDLWQDIIEINKEKGNLSHYMGYLVLQTDDEKSFDIIDGQQRLTTLSIFVLAAMKNIKDLTKDEKNTQDIEKRLETLRQTYIGYLDPVTLIPQSKLTLNRNNDSYYQNYIVPLIDKLPQRKFKASENLIRKAFEWFKEKIKKYTTDSEDKSRFLAQLIEITSDRLSFTVITVNDQLNAYKVFETLNARGVRLSATDLLKNYLFSILDDKKNEKELTALEDHWESIVNRLGAESLPDFLRVHWIGRHNFVRKADMFKAIRKKIQNKEEVFRLLRCMEEDIDTYLFLSKPESYKSENDRSYIYARTLDLFSIKQPFSLLISGKRQLNEEDFIRLIKIIVVISFRYNIIENGQTSEQENIYHSVALKISNGEIIQINDIKNALKSLYPSDESFRGSFSEKTFSTKQSRNKRIVKYILSEIERKQSGRSVGLDESDVNIEHICPINPEEGWEQFKDQDLDIFCDRLGNMTLLESHKNREIGNIEYTIKKEIYMRSNLSITSSIAQENDDWTPEKIKYRQKKMAKIATSIWRVDGI